MVANAKKRGSSTGEVTVKNDGVVLASGINTLNFDGGTEIEVVVTGVGEVTVFHPAPAFQPYWPTGVSDPTFRTTARISSPEGGEGTPFSTGGWAATNQGASRTASVSLASPGNRTGFGGDSTFEVKVFDADGLSLLDSYTTPAITANGVHTSPSTRITVTIANFGTDTTRWQAKPTVAVNIAGVFTDNSLDGGRYHIEATHHTDTVSDGGQSFTFVQGDVFYDTNATTPSISTISGSVGVGETIGQINTKHLSGLEYYILGSQFTVTVSGINQLNRNTARTSANLRVRGTEFGLPELNHSPFGTGSSYFSGWGAGHNQDAVEYSRTDWAINKTNYRYISPSAHVDARPRDPWAVGSTTNSPNNTVLIDTYGTTSTATFEGLDDEARREYVDGVGASATTKSFGGAGSFDSEKHLSVSGTVQGIVMASYLRVPSETTYIRSDGFNSSNANWVGYKPDLNGPNPDYSSLVVASGINYARRFTQTSGSSIPSFQMVFSGTFAGGNALTDLQNGDLEIYVYRIAIPGGTPGIYGPPPGNTRPLRVHEVFNFALYDDGLTVAGSGIREGMSSGNTINCTFGTGTPADTGFYCHILLLNENIAINSISVTFF